MAEFLEFFVAGVAEAQGSMRHIGNGRMIHTKELVAWRKLVADECRLAIRKNKAKGYPKAGHVYLNLSFDMPRPKNHFTVSAAVKVRFLDAQPTSQATKDLDKLQRAILDALTGVTWVNDAQVVEIYATKSYVRDRNSDAGVMIEILTLEED